MQNSSKVRVKKPKDKQLLKKAWALFSKYIRTKYSKNGLVSCVTCGVTMPIAKMQAGHYIRRQKKNLLFDERNVHPQCLICNYYRDGEPQKYAIFLRQKYGETILEELDEQASIIKKWTISELENIIETYK